MLKLHEVIHQYRADVAAGSFLGVVPAEGHGDRARRPVAELLGRTWFLFFCGLVGL
jgi:hypothetical protein